MKRKPYFEGWYFKHQTVENTICLIPGISIDELGEYHVFIQILTNNESHYLEFPETEFKLQRSPLRIKIGENYFTETGVRLNIDAPGIRLKGSIQYGQRQPLIYDIMGPFKCIPFLECNHGIISMNHSLWGNLRYNDMPINFDKGIGFIEKDWGSSFPKKYLWTQCNQFPTSTADCSIMAAISHIPFGQKEFEGCICSIYYKNKEYRLATYLNAKITHWHSHGFEITQGRHRLKFTRLSKNAKPLKAPINGAMKEIVHEHPCCKARYEFYINDILIFHLTSDYASFEYH